MTMANPTDIIPMFTNNDLCFFPPCIALNIFEIVGNLSARAGNSGTCEENCSEDFLKKHLQSETRTK